MQILDIVLYGDENRIRRLTLKPGQLNIITGASKTGKSALSNIVAYCLGEDRFLVPAGVITNCVRWYGLRLQFSSTQVFIARRAPDVTERISGAVHLSSGAELDIPTADLLNKNTNTNDMREKLARLLHIEPNLHIPDEGETRLPLEAKISHALIFNFQQQGEIANRDFLFHHQGEQFRPQAIKDTLPYFLGAVREGHLAKVQELRRARRDIARAEKQKNELDNINGEGISRGLSLLAEAQEAGIITLEAQPSDLDSLKKAMSKVIQWNPKELPAVPGDALTRLQEERSVLLSDYRKLRDRIKAAKHCAEGQATFEFEAREQQVRLQTISLYQNPTSDTSICPICQSVLEVPPPVASDFQAALDKISSQLSNVSTENPRLREQIELMENQMREVSRKLDENRLATSAITSQQPNVFRLDAVWRKYWHYNW